MASGWTGRSAPRRVRRLAPVALVLILTLGSGLLEVVGLPHAVAPSTGMALPSADRFDGPPLGFLNAFPNGPRPPSGGGSVPSIGNPSVTWGLSNDTALPGVRADQAGASPGELAVDLADHTLWLGYNASVAGLPQNVTLVDLADGRVTGEVPDTPAATALLYDANSERMYVAEWAGAGNGSVAVLNATTLAPETAPIPVGPDPDAMVLDPWSGGLWVASGDSGNITEIATATLSARSVPLPAGTLSAPEQATGVTYDPVNGDLYVLCEGLGASVFVLNGSTGAAAAPAILEPNTFTLDTNIVYDAADQRVFVLVRNESFGSVLEVIDPEIQAAVGEITMDNGPLSSNIYSNSMVLDPSTGSIILAGARWWESGDEGDLGIMDPRTGSINWSSGYSGPGPFAQAFDPSTGIDYVSHQGMDYLTALNVSNPAPGARTILLGGSAYPGAYDPSDGRIVIPEAYTNEDPVDGGSLPNGLVLLPPSAQGSSSDVPIGPNATALSGYPGGYAPDSVLDDASHGALYVASYRSPKVVVLNASTMGPESNVTLPFSPTGGAFDPVDDGVVYANPFEVAFVSERNGSVTSYALRYPCYSYPDGPQEDVAVNPTTGVVYYVPGANGCSPNQGMVIWNPLNGSATSVNNVPYPDWNAVAFDPADGDLYIADLYGNVVDVVNATTFATLATYPVGSSPDYVAFDPSGDLILVANAVSNNLTILNGSSAAAGAGPHGNVSAGIDPTSITVVPALDQVYIEDSGGGSIVEYATQPLVRAFTTSPSETDVGVPVSIAVSAVGGSGPLSYAYSGLPAGCTSGNSPGITCAPTGNGTFVVTAKVTDEVGDVAMASLTLVVASDPVLAISEFPLVVENEGTVSFVGLASGGTGPFSIAWTFGDGGTGTGVGTSHFYLGAGPYAVTAVLTDAVGRTASANVTLVIAGSPSPSLQAPGGTRAVGAVLDFVGGVSDGVGPIVFNWTFGDGTTLVSGGNPNGSATFVSRVSHIYERPGTYEYEMSIWDGAGFGTELNGTIEITATSKGTSAAPFPYAPVLLGVADAAALSLVAIMLLRRRSFRRSGPKGPT